MENWIKKLFCKHIYENIGKKQFTSKVIMEETGIFYRERLKIKMKCIKCGKEKSKIQIQR